MHQWRDEALILASTRHGEDSAVVHILTRFNGRTSGFLRAASSPRVRPHIQSGNCVVAAWHARLPDQLGTLTIEPLQALATHFMQRSELSLVLQSVTHMLLYALPERQAFPEMFEVTRALLQTIHTNENWAEAYIWWEIHLLAALGFGLRLNHCVQTESMDDLTHVSPRSGHAVSRDLASPYASRLLKLPAFLGGSESFGALEVPVGMALTGYFLNMHVVEPLGKALPEARQRLNTFLQRPPIAAAQNNYSLSDEQKYAHG
jgi:DNA repair protein RecO (recombination protein O)